MSGTRVRVPEDLAARLSQRATREGAGSSVVMALRLLDLHVDEDLPPADRRPPTAAGTRQERR